MMELDGDLHKQKPQNPQNFASNLLATNPLHLVFMW